MRYVLVQLACSTPLVALCACGPADFTPVTTGKHFRVQGLSTEEGCLTCDLRLPDLGQGRQTPKALGVGILAVELLRSPFDLNPHTVMRSDAPIATDLVAGATFADVDIGSIPPGVYPFMRVTLANTTFTVDATAHVTFSGVYDGELQVDYALSAYHDPERGKRRQGDYHAEFSAPEITLPVSSSCPVSWPVPYPGATVDTSGGLYRVTFMSPETIYVDHDMPQAVDVRVTFHIEDAFAWAEREAPDNQEGVFDLSPDPVTGEPPVSLGISGFSIELVAIEGEPVIAQPEEPALDQEPAAQE